jgi:hypothetical protein
MIERKLGKLPYKHDPRHLTLSHYLGTLPPAPPTLDYSHLVQYWPMYENDRYGDCTIAGAAHMYWVWDAIKGIPCTVTDSDVLKAYNVFDPGFQTDPNNDNGAVIADVLKYWRGSGLFKGDRILAYAKVDALYHQQLKTAISLFQGAYIGVQLPLTAQSQSTWQYIPNTSDNAPGSWGGHCVNLVGYDAQYLTCVTWGATLQMTWDFFDHYCDEAWAIIPAEFQGEKGFDLTTLEQDLQIVSNAPPNPTPPSPTPPSPSGCNLPLALLHRLLH